MNTRSMCTFVRLMEVIATTAEAEALLKAQAEKKYLLLPEDRRYPIILIVGPGFSPDCQVSGETHE